MSEEVTMSPMKNYTVYGELLIPHEILMRSDDTISIDSYGSSVFYNWAEYERTGEFPELVNEISAFHVRDLSSSTGRIINGFDAIITSMIKYDISPANNTVSITFKYRRAGESVSDIPTIKPVITHIIVDEEFIALVIEGDTKATKKMIDSLSCFRHSDVVYYKQNIYEIYYFDRADVERGQEKKTIMGHIYIACSKKLAPEEGLSRFKSKLKKILRSYYA